MKRTELRKQSKKYRRLVKARRELCIDVAERANGFCEAEFPCCTYLGMEVHEIQSRARGGSILDIDNCRWVCTSIRQRRRQGGY